MSQQGRLVDIISSLETLTGNSGGAVAPDGLGNIDIVGSGTITVTGNPGLNTLTISDDGTLAITFDADSGSATPAANILNIVAESVTAGTDPIQTTGAGNTITVQSQISQAIPAADSTKVGICNFDSTMFDVDADGFVTLIGGSTGIDSFSPDSGTDPVVPDGAGLVNMNGSGSITTVGSLNTLTTQLTGLTQYNVLVGAGTTTITKVAPSATSGVPLISQGAAADPAFGTAVVAGGGTGAISLTDGGIILGSGTGAVTVTSQPTDGQLLIGSTGLDPVLGSLTSTGSTIAITTGAGTINLETGTAVATSFPTDSGTATPSAGALTVAGGTLLNSSGSGSTVTINADDNVVGTVGSDSGTATPSSNNFDIVGTGGITTSGATDTITIDGSGISSFTWNVETGTSATMAVNNGYIANNASTVTFTLPDTAAVGDIVRVTSIQAAWSIAQNAGETIYFGDQSTTTGAGGSLTSTDTRDAIHLVCVVANTDWQTLSSVGNITVV